MKRLILLGVFFLVLGLGIAKYRFDGKSFQASQTPINPPLQEKPVEIKPRFQVGERAVYSLRWMGWEVARSEAEIQEIVPLQGREAYHIVLKNRSNAFLDLIFKVRDEYHSYLDTEDLKTLRFEKIVQEGGYRADEEIDFDHATGKARYHSRTNGGRKTFSFEPGAVDAIAAVYKFRFALLEKSGELKMPLTWDEKNYDLRLAFKEEGKPLPSVLGERFALKVTPYIPKTDDPNIKSSRVWIWVSANEDRIPLRMKTQVPIAGSVNAVLTEYQSKT